MPSTIYDVTTWTIPGSPATTAQTDIGAIINSIIADIKAAQPVQGSKPGAVIYIPPGDYSLKTRILIDGTAPGTVDTSSLMSQAARARVWSA